MRSFAVAMLFFFMFIATSQAGLFGPKIPTSVAYEVTDSELAPLATSLSKEQEHVLLAIEARIQDRSLKDISKRLKVRFANQEELQMNSLARDFRVKRAIITAMEPNMLAGFLEFADDTNRLLIYRFNAGYILQDSSAEVEVLALTVVTSTDPIATIMLVPSARMNASSVGNYVATFNQAKAANITSASSKPKDMQKYIVLAFLKTLHTPGLNVELQIANTQDEAGNSSKSINKYYDQGWLVIANEVQMDLATQTKWAKVVVDNGAESKVIAERQL